MQNDLYKPLDVYIQDAKDHLGLKSDRELDRFMGFKGQPVTHWRAGRAFPARETMVKLARLGGNDPEIAVINLEIMSAKTELKPLYQSILRKVAANSPAWILAATLALGSPGADAKSNDFQAVNPADFVLNHNENKVTENPRSLYYGK